MKTLVFSNINGNILSETSVAECSFTKSQAKVLKENIKEKGCNLVFINAEGLANDGNYCKSILNCFNKIGISFNKTLELNLKSSATALEKFPKSNRVYFLMGGNPYNQMQVVEKFNLKETLKTTEDFVIGFCAGAINLSRQAIITSDDDFKEPSTYVGIGRIPLNIEPHFKLDKTEFTKNRIKEINAFCKTLKIEITALCDKSCILIDGKNYKVYGRIYKF